MNQVSHSMVNLCRSDFTYADRGGDGGVRIGRGFSENLQNVGTGALQIVCRADIYSPVIILSVWPLLVIVLVGGTKYRRTGIKQICCGRGGRKEERNVQAQER